MGGGGLESTTPGLAIEHRHQAGVLGQALAVESKSSKKQMGGVGLEPTTPCM